LFFFFLQTANINASSPVITTNEAAKIADEIDNNEDKDINILESINNRRKELEKYT
jgi:hypothetical protein